MFGLIGAFVGAKLLWTFEHYGEEPVISLLVSRGGLSWFGGLVGGVGAGFAVIRVRRFPLVSVLAAATPALALGDAIGRVGCFLVGDDYGRPRTCRGPSRSLAGCRGPLFPYIRHNSTKRYRSCFSRGHSSDGVGLAFLTGSFSVDTACWLAPYASRSNSFA